MFISGNGFVSSQTVVSVTNSTTLEISANASSTPSGTLTFSGYQGTQAVAVGYLAGEKHQGNSTVAVGAGAGSINQGEDSVAVGKSAGQQSQSYYSTAIGSGAGQLNQQAGATALGKGAGYIDQGSNAVAVGVGAGTNYQSTQTVAVGGAAGGNVQGQSAVAIGFYAGFEHQGQNSVAIGSFAGITLQGNNSIIINATGANLNQTTANTFTVAPVRNDTSNIAQVVFYNTTSKEVTYGNTINVAGNISAGNIVVGAFGNIFSGAYNASPGYNLFLSVSTGTMSLVDQTNQLSLPAGIDLRGNTILYSANNQVRGTITANTGTISVTGNITGGNLITAGNITGNTGGFAIGYRDIPQVVFTSNATLALTDAGKHYFSSNSANIITVPNNTTVSFNIGTAISIVQQGTANLTVTPGSGVTMYLAGNSTSSSRTLGNYGMATLMKVDTNTWFINGTGVN
jgi:hypothetical protein